MPSHGQTACRCGVVFRGRGSKCPKCASNTRALADSRRGTANARGYNYRWSRARASYLRTHPLCALCEAIGRVTPASVVDHVRPHKGDAALFWDTSNWQALCKPCHDHKTATEDGGFGRSH